MPKFGGSFQLVLILVLVTVQGRRAGSRSQSWVGYCKVPHCDDCETHTRCGQCEHGYFKDNWECSPCSEIHSECVECSDGNTCTECKEGYHPSNGSCQKCPEGCASCSSQSVCDSCEAGYGKEGDACVVCEYQVENCKHCSTPGGAGDNRIQNHDFQEPDLNLTNGNGDYALPTSWEYTDMGFNVGILHYDDAPDGPQVLYMPRFSTGDSYEVWQSVSGLTPGQECTFSFYYRRNLVGTNSSNLTFKIGDTEEASVLTSDHVNWVQESGTFTPTAETMTITFSVTDNNLGFYTCLLYTSDAADE